MELVVIVLNKVECLETLLGAFADNGITGATVLDSTGMARVLSDVKEEVRIFGTLSMMFNPERQESKTIFTVLPREKTSLLKQLANEVVGDFSQPDTGIIFGVPINFVEGIGGID